MTTLKTIDDIYAYFDCEPNIDELNHHIYNITPFGGHVSYQETPVTRTRRERWQYMAHPSLIGTVLAVRRSCRGEWITTARNVPDEVLLYMETDAKNTRIVTRLTLQDLRTNQRRQRGNKGVVTVDVARDTGKLRRELVFGSIVEGSGTDAPAQIVTLPCLPKDIDTALANLDEITTEIWDSANDGETGDLE